MVEVSKIQVKQKMTRPKTTFVEDENKKENAASEKKDYDHQIPTVVAIIFIGFLFGLYGIVYLIDGILPGPLNIGDEKHYPNDFIAERAQQNLKVLTSVGPRVVGSYENEVAAVEFFKTQITLIQQHAHPSQKIEVDVQRVSGSYDLSSNGRINAYGNVQNVVVKLHGKGSSEHSLLVNAHFDTVPVSSGGSDDGINCVASLEVLRKLSISSEKFQHNIIFLFNGAEEALSQAAHGFITQHKWAKEVKVVINLEAVGAGGKMMLFLVGPKPSWLLSYYRKVPHLSAQATAEEMFSNGLIPYDTDFWIFRDFGNVVGFDFAFVRNGYRYHTRFDNFSNIPAGSYQYVGDNTLSLVRNLANAPELANPHEQETEKVVFYDYLGLFMISYSQTTAIIIYSVTAALSIIVAVKNFYDFELGFSKKSMIYLGLTFCAILLGWIAAGLFVIIIASIIDLFNASMSWYNNPWIIFGVYGAPIVIVSSGSILILNHFNKFKPNISVGAHTQIQALLSLILWIVPLLTGTLLGFRFVYMLFIPVFFQTLAFAIIQVSCMQHSTRAWQIIYVVATIIPNIFLMHVALTAMTFIIPMCGRTGSNINPEYIISFEAFPLVLLITSFYTPLITLVRNPSLLLGILFALFVTFFIIIFTPLGFPYSGDFDHPAPQRFWIYHMSRTFRNETNEIYSKDAGFFIMNRDRNSPHSIKSFVKDLEETISVENNCNNNLLCGLPLGRYRSANPHESIWIPAEHPNIDQHVNLKLNSITNVEDSVIRFNFTASGPDHMEVYISPKIGIKLNAISLLPKLPQKTPLWNGRPLYAIIYTWGKENTPLTFTIDVGASNNLNEPMLDIALVGQHLHDKVNIKTPRYTQFLSQFPNWADPIAWLGEYESWVY